MFLHLSVILFTKGLCTPPWADTLLGRPPPLSRLPPRADTLLGRQLPRQTSSLGRHPPPPTETATAADSMHPTGMHPCYMYFSYGLFRAVPSSFVITILNILNYIFPSPSNVSHERLLRVFQQQYFFRN